METEIIQDLKVPVIAIDGGAGVGKGTVRQILAQRLGFHALDSGVLYRALGLVCHEERITEIPKMAERAIRLNLRFEGEDVWVDDRNRTKDVRSELGSKQASFVSKIPEVREALYAFQLSMRKFPGLVADGRDQGFIFEKSFRYFLKARLEVQAGRRFRQLQAQGKFPVYNDILEGIRRRDHADSHRIVSPLRPHDEAMIIDTSYITAEQVAHLILGNYKSRSY